MSAAIRISIVFLLLFGGVYPAVVLGAGQVLFHDQAQGSLVMGKGGQPVGSKLIGQAFDKDGYFHPRPSAAGVDGYDATASGGSNLAPTSKALVDRVTASAAALKAENPSLTVLPADLLTTSASGLDPDISVAGAMAQTPRVAKARSLSESEVTALIQSHTTPRSLGLLGDPRVNVLELNLALDALASGAR